jgi:hypothetical protein
MYELLPPKRLPLFYLGFSTVCFSLALIGAIRFAQDFTGFYYHPRILTLTHLITLGWITANILGFLFIVAPMALHTQLKATWVDAVAFCLFVIGVAGMASHFWISHVTGMAYSAGCAYAALVITVIRWVGPVKRPARLSRYVKLHILFAFSNLLLATGWGVVIAINKAHPFLPILPAANVLAHAHMAAIGWVMILVFGIAYRLLPMFLPGQPAKGSTPWISAILMETGILGLFGALLFQSSWNLLFAIIVVAGIALFLQQSIKTGLHRKPVPPPTPPQPDFAILHAAAGFFWLVVAAISGLMLTRLAPTESSLRLALVYAFLGLVGFMSQLIVGMKPKVLSIFAWYYAFSSTGDNKLIPRPIDMPVRPIQATIFGLWLVGVPAFASGIWKASRMAIVAGAVALLAATILDTIHTVAILRQMRSRLKQ